MKMVRTAAALVPAFALGVVLGQPPLASSEGPSCERRQAQVDKAEAALARVQARQSAHPSQSKAQQMRLAKANERLASCLAR